MIANRAIGSMVGVVLIGLAAPGSARSDGGRPVAPMYLETPVGQKPRVVITADPELDDSNSMVRYLLYSTDFRTEGLIYASSQFHWKGDGKGTRFSVPGREYKRFGLNLCPCTSWRWAPGERFIDDAVDAYAAAYPNLRVHHPGYPAPAVLRSKIRWGNVEFDGEMAKDTPGSNLIRSLLLDDEEAPIYLHAWGGQSTIARALKSIEDRYRGTPEWTAIRARVIRKAVIQPSGDQDDTYARYIHPNWPEIRYREQIDGINLGYGAQMTASEEDARYFSAPWMRRNITGRGRLGAFERVWGDGKSMVPNDRFDYFGIPAKSAEDLRAAGYVVWLPPLPKGEFLGEGDTPTFLNLLDNGLRGYRGESLGGWGGFAPRTASAPVVGSFAAGMVGQETVAAGQPPAIRRKPTHPFLAPAQRDWAARFHWAVTPTFAAANHNPRITLRMPGALTVRPGQRIPLNAVTSDPDGNAVALKWWVLQDAGTYKGSIPVQPRGTGAELVVPAGAQPGDSIQVVAEATDDGVPMLTRYEKVVLTVGR